MSASRGKTEPNHPAFRKTALVTNSWLRTRKKRNHQKHKKVTHNPPTSPTESLLWHSGSGRRKWASLHDRKACIQTVSFPINHPPARVYATTTLTSAVLQRRMKQFIFKPGLVHLGSVGFSYAAPGFYYDWPAQIPINQPTNQPLSLFIYILLETFLHDFLWHTLQAGSCIRWDGSGSNKVWIRSFLLIAFGLLRFTW